MTIIQPDNLYQEQFDDLEFASELYGRRTYSYDAVSGAQIRVQLGTNVLVDDCTAVQFTLTQSKKPIFGYNSQLFDTVAPGIVLVQGRLFINFIHQGYLRTLMEAAIKNTGADLFQPDREFVAPSPPIDEETVLRFVKRRNLEEVQELVNPDRLSGKMTDRPDEKPRISITIKYADDEYYGAPQKTIYDAHFIGEGQEVQISGQPIQEWYEFLARRVL